MKIEIYRIPKSKNKNSYKEVFEEKTTQLVLFLNLRLSGLYFDFESLES